MGGGRLRLPGGAGRCSTTWVEPTARRFGVGTRAVAALEARPGPRAGPRAPAPAGPDDGSAAFAAAVGYRVAGDWLERELTG